MKNHTFAIDQNYGNIPTAEEVATRVLANYGSSDDGIEDGLQKWLEAEHQLLNEKHPIGKKANNYYRYYY